MESEDCRRIHWLTALLGNCTNSAYTFFNIKSSTKHVIFVTNSILIQTMVLVSPLPPRQTWQRPVLG